MMVQRLGSTVAARSLDPRAVNGGPKLYAEPPPHPRLVARCEPL